MQKFRIIFIDDSGDPGLKAVSSRFLVFAAVVFDTPEPVAEVEGILNEFKRRRYLREKYELKFNKLRKSLILELLKYVRHIDFRVSVVYIDKRKPLPIQKYNLYGWGISELLKVVEANKTDSGVYYKVIRNHIDQIKEL